MNSLQPLQFRAGTFGLLYVTGEAINATQKNPWRLKIGIEDGLNSWGKIGAAEEAWWINK